MGTGLCSWSRCGQPVSCQSRRLSLCHNQEPRGSTVLRTVDTADRRGTSHPRLVLELLLSRPAGWLGGLGAAPWLGWGGGDSGGGGRWRRDPGTKPGLYSWVMRWPCLTGVPNHKRHVHSQAQPARCRGARSGRDHTANLPKIRSQGMAVPRMGLPYACLTCTLLLLPLMITKTVALQLRYACVHVCGWMDG